MKKIMLIDSDILHLREMNNVLSGDFNVLICSRGHKAWDLYNLFNPDALVLDPTAAGLDTSDFFPRIRKKSWPNSIPIIATTRLNTLQHIERSFDWGADIVFSKPCEGERIRNKLLELLSRGESPRELALA